jgi:hypothetical protein
LLTAALYYARYYPGIANPLARHPGRALSLLWSRSMPTANKVSWHRRNRWVFTKTINGVRQFFSPHARTPHPSRTT